jgi:hypothetical protein
MALQNSDLKGLLQHAARGLERGGSQAEFDAQARCSSCYGPPASSNKTRHKITTFNPQVELAARWGGARVGGHDVAEVVDERGRCAAAAEGQVARGQQRAVPRVPPEVVGGPGDLRAELPLAAVLLARREAEVGIERGRSAAIGLGSRLRSTTMSTSAGSAAAIRRRWCQPRRRFSIDGRSASVSVGHRRFYLLGPRTWAAGPALGASPPLQREGWSCLHLEGFAWPWLPSLRCSA